MGCPECRCVPHKLGCSRRAKSGLVLPLSEFERLSRELVEPAREIPELRALMQRVDERRAQ